MLDLVPANLPKNVNGFRTTHTCELCGFEPKTKNKYREKQDHLVMKHFKEKIDKIFPHCRPYSCPSSECSFTGKDKQALLRHYTGKHGILEKYLREALAEKGISYVPGDHGGKRKNSTSSDSSNGTKAKKAAGILNNVLANNQAAVTTTMIDPKDMLPKSPVPMTVANGLAQQQRPNNEELRKEVEAMMASFQPQQQQTTTVNGHVKVNLPTSPVPVTMMTTANGTSGGDKRTVILSNKSVSNLVPNSSVVSLVKRSEASNGMDLKPTIIMANGTKLHFQPNQHVISIPELILPNNADGSSSYAIPIEVITTSVANGNGLHSGVVENEEVMWGAGTSLGPAVVVEAADTVPVTYIEASEIVYSAASLDNIDYDYLYPVTTSTTSVIHSNGIDTSAASNDSGNATRSSVRERQLEFNML